MEVFEGYRRREAPITACLGRHGFSSPEEARAYCLERGIDTKKIVRETQPGAFDSAVYALATGAAIALKNGSASAEAITRNLGEGLQAYCVPGSIADKRQVGYGHTRLTAMLLGDGCTSFCFLAGHESFAAAAGARRIAAFAGRVRKKPLRILLNGLGKEAAYMIARGTGITYVHTTYDHAADSLSILWEKPFSEGSAAAIRCYGAEDLNEGLAIMRHEAVDASITGNGTNPVRFQNPVAGIYARECHEQGRPYFSVASGMAVGNSLHPDNLWAGPGSNAITDSMARMHASAMFAGSSSVPAHVDMMGFIGMGNSPLVGALLMLTVLLMERQQQVHATPMQEE